MKKILTFLFGLFLAAGFSLQANAGLYNRGTDSLGNRLIYDSDLNITWYDYSQAFNFWQAQNTWTQELSVNYGGVVYDDWRLPSALNSEGTGPCSGFDCAGSEMGHLYYVGLGNKGYCDAFGSCNQSGYGLLNIGPFINLQPSYYWFGSESGGIPASASFFHFYSGDQGTTFTDEYMNALAVRPGDVVVVAEPVSSVLFLTGGAALIGRKYSGRKKMKA